MATPLSNEPQLTARAAGFFWLTTFVTGLMALIAYGKVIVARDAAATAANILANKTLFQLSTALNLMATLAYVAVVALIYLLFKPASRRLALLAALFGLVGCAIGGFSGVFQLVPLIVLQSNSGAFTAAQLQELAYLFVNVGGKAGNIGLVFFAFHCLLTGVLIVKSAFVPRAIGALMVIAGIGWFTFVWPPLANALAPYNMLPGMLGEGSLTLWLLVMGVNVERWRKQAGATPSHSPIVNTSI